MLPSRAQIQRRGARRQQHTAGVTVGSQSHSDGTDSVTELVREMNACGRAPSTIHLSHTTEIIHPSRLSGRRARTRAASRGARGPERSGGARGQAQARPPGARMRPSRGGERMSFSFACRHGRNRGAIGGLDVGRPSGPRGRRRAMARCRRATNGMKAERPASGRHPLLKAGVCEMQVSKLTVQQSRGQPEARRDCAAGTTRVIPAVSGTARGEARLRRGDSPCQTSNLGDSPGRGQLCIHD